MTSNNLNGSAQAQGMSKKDQKKAIKSLEKIRDQLYNSAFCSNADFRTYDEIAKEIQAFKLIRDAVNALNEAVEVKRIDDPEFLKGVN